MIRLIKLTLILSLAAAGSATAKTATATGAAAAAAIAVTGAAAATGGQPNGNNVPLPGTPILGRIIELHPNPKKPSYVIYLDEYSINYITISLKRYNRKCDGWDISVRAHHTTMMRIHNIRDLYNDLKTTRWADVIREHAAENECVLDETEE